MFQGKSSLSLVQGGIFQGKIYGGKSPRVNCSEGNFMRVNCPVVIVPGGKYSGGKVRGDFIGDNCLGVIVPGVLFRVNSPGEKVRGIIVVRGDFMGAIAWVGSCPRVNVRIT